MCHQTSLLLIRSHVYFIIIFHFGGKRMYQVKWLYCHFIAWEMLCIQNGKFIGMYVHARLRILNKRVNTVNCVSVCTVYTTCWSECGDNNARRPLSRRLNSTTRSHPGRIVFLYVPSVVWLCRHRRHGKITKKILVMGGDSGYMI